jgi:hypothetical protein
MRHLRDAGVKAHELPNAYTAALLWSREFRNAP